MSGRIPLPVKIFDFNSFTERYLGSRNPNAWGYLEIRGYSRYSHSGQINNAWISINSNNFKKTACHNQDAHAYAASLFLQYMSDQKVDKAIDEIWKSLNNHDELFKAIADGFSDPDWYKNWPDFIKNLYSGNYTKAMPGTTWSIHTNSIIDATNTYKLDDPYTQINHQFSSKLYPFYIINMNYKYIQNVDII